MIELDDKGIVEKTIDANLFQLYMWLRFLLLHLQGSMQLGKERKRYDGIEAQR